MLEEKDIVEQEEQQLAENKQENSVEEQAQNKSESQQQEETGTGTTDELSVLKTALEEQKDKYLRLFAEFDNFKKRNLKERSELLKTAGQDIIRELLPVLDDFQRADKALAQDNNAENYANGVKLIREKLQRTLQNKGLKIIESVGKDFDVSQHEAVAEVPAAGEEQKGKIIDEVESGYTLNGTIIRYAKVVVGK